MILLVQALWVLFMRSAARHDTETFIAFPSDRLGQARVLADREVSRRASHEFKTLLETDHPPRNAAGDDFRWRYPALGICALECFGQQCSDREGGQPSTAQCSSGSGGTI